MPEESPFEVETRRTPAGLEVRLAGELDVSTRDRFVAAVGERLEGDVAVDMTGVTFLDSSGLAALVIAADRVARDGATMRVVAMSTPVQSLLTRTGLLEHLAGEGDQPGR